MAKNPVLNFYGRFFFFLHFSHFQRFSHFSFQLACQEANAKKVAPRSDSTLKVAGEWTQTGRSLKILNFDREKSLR
jgi:hypothetical protein